ncbi:MAG: protein-L-isoaspartate(D-aspartate) O-methyltransferase [Candidatus Aureabacteria bacterium]|nr:protein-L-isoaspartate(D-aspartate) O-methyltransferase [Candidatus Auribacterota bacterium]
MAILRERMVVEQIEGRGVSDERVLAAMRRIPRHEFVPPRLIADAYEDHPLPIGDGQTISQPYIVAYMTQALRLKPGDRVLEVGTGSGYQAAILSEITEEVYTIEIIPELARTAEERLRRLGYGKVNVRAGDGYFGWPEAAPFDAIIVTAAPDKVPPKLVEQLKEGGRMLIPVGEERSAQELIRLTKRNGKVETENLLPVRFVPLTGNHK